MSKFLDSFLQNHGLNGLRIVNSRRPLDGLTRIRALARVVSITDSWAEMQQPASTIWNSRTRIQSGRTCSWDATTACRWGSGIHADREFDLPIR